MIEEWLMGIGAVIALIGSLAWTAGEMYAVKKDEDTTTSYVRRGRRKSRLVRISIRLFTTVCVLFAIWLHLHFNYNFM